MIKFFSKNRKIIIIAIIIIVIFLFGLNNALALTTGEAAIGLGGYALGTVGYAVSLVLSIIAYVLTAVIGLLFTVVVAVLIQVAQYGNIINVPTVIEGWVIIRDLCNMLFILILLVIAFATILRVESYNYKKLLPKLLIMAILINFSRTIFGLLVDFSQVIMLTFVNSFKEGGGHFVDTFRTDKLFSIKVLDTTGKNFVVDTWSTAVAIIAGVIAAIITLIVVSMMLAILVIRIIMLWIYTIFSPLIFLGFAVPAIQKYTGRIWEDFTKQLVVGPVLAFFIWLALTTANKSTGLLMEQNLTSTEVCVGAGAFFCQENFQKFIIVIGLLVGGLMMAQQVGGAVGSIAGKGMDWAKKVASVPHRGLRAMRDYSAEKLHERTGVDLNLARVWAGIKEKRKEKQAERYATGMRKAEKVMAEGRIVPGLLAMTGTPATAWEQITSLKGLRQRFKGGKSLARAREKISPELESTKFQLATSGLNKEDRAKEMAKINENIKNNEAAIKQAEADKDTKKAQQLKAQNDMFKQKSDFLESTKDKDFTKKERDDLSSKAADLQMKYNKNIPLYDFNARAAEQDAINKKAAKIKDINEPSELLRILRDAITEKDKTMVKAITKKMTQNYDDNEFLQPLAGDTSFKGLQELMRKFSDKNDDLYAGFDKQEASSLGSEISYLARSRNHWAATGAYRMENGFWRETNEVEQAAYMSNEMGKMHPQVRARENNRLAFGSHDAKGDYHITLGGLKALQTFDTAPQLKQFTDNINESFLKNVATGDNMDKLRAARDRGAFKAQDDKGRDIVKIIEDAIATLVKKGTDTEEDQYEKFRDIFTEKI